MNKIASELVRIAKSVMVASLESDFLRKLKSNAIDLFWGAAERKKFETHLEYSVDPGEPGGYRPYVEDMKLDPYKFMKLLDWDEVIELTDTEREVAALRDSGERVDLPKLVQKASLGKEKFDIDVKASLDVGDIDLLLEAEVTVKRIDSRGILLQFEVDLPEKAEARKVERMILERGF